MLVIQEYSDKRGFKYSQTNEIESYFTCFFETPKLWVEGSALLLIPIVIPKNLGIIQRFFDN